MLGMISISEISLHSLNTFLIQNGSPASLELDIEHYVVPAPSSANSGPVYAANMAETPRSLRAGTFSRNDSSCGSSQSQKDLGASVDRPGVWCYFFPPVFDFELCAILM